VGLATVVLGPWGGILALSTAILIQALFFGDGGITAFGANSFNMAIAGCLVTFAIYRVLAKAFGKRTWSQPIAAATAAYIAINVSALLAGIEFGIQPMLFKDAVGHPLYAPFPLSVAIPAMLIGHLTIAGLAEFAITAGVIAYLQRTSPGLLAFNREKPAATVIRWKPAVAVLAALIVLTPLGLLTMGHAWGEWSASDFQKTDTRTEIAKAAGGTVIPPQAPAGLQRLEKLWTAPFRNYAPGFISNNSAGYIVSAITGVALLTLVIFTLGAIAKRSRPPNGEKPI
jgi:cobalt/nickel transport system permease protein